jgi:hypothetical protein
MPELERAKSLLRKSEGCCCAVVTASGEELALGGQGISPLVALLKDGKNALRGAAAADKVIGKAAAMLLACGGAAAVWGDIVSRPAQEFLLAAGIELQYGRLVPYLKNRAGTGQCPMEARAEGLETLEQAYEAFVSA